MGTLTTVTRQPETIQAFQLDQPSDMVQVLLHISAYASNAYSGSVTLQNTAGAPSWQLLINNQTNNASGFATIGDYVILENDTGTSGVVSICKAADYANLYATPGS